MSTLFVDRRGADVDAEGDTVVVRVEGERKGTIPLKPLERVVIKGTARLTTRLLTKLVQHGIGLLVLGGRTKRPTAALIGSPSSDAILRLAQANLLRNEPARAAISQGLVSTKIKGQLAILRQAETCRGRTIELDRGIEALTRALTDIEAGNPSRPRLRGLEGAAAAAYFMAFGTLFAPSLAFQGRNRRPPRDPVNACLSLGYTLLHFDAVRAAASLGLDVVTGIYHDLAPGRESLACDLAEPFRPGVDRLVLHLFESHELRVEHFSTTKDGCLLGKAARRRFYTAYEEAATGYRPALAHLARELAEAIGEAEHGLAEVTLPSLDNVGGNGGTPENMDHRL